MNSNTNQNLYLQGLSVQELKELLTQLFQDEINQLKCIYPKLPILTRRNPSTENPDDKYWDLLQEPEYLTRGEVAKILKISLPTLHNYVKQGLIKSYRIGGKVRFVLEEIRESLTERNFASVNRKGGQNAA